MTKKVKQKDLMKLQKRIKDKTAAPGAPVHESEVPATKEVLIIVGSRIHRIRCDGTFNLSKGKAECKVNRSSNSLLILLK